MECFRALTYSESRGNRTTLTRDSERILLADPIHGAASSAGWAPIEAPSDKEQRFLEIRNIELIEASLLELLSETAADAASR